MTRTNRRADEANSTLVSNYVAVIWYPPRKGTYALKSGAQFSECKCTSRSVTLLGSLDIFKPEARRVQLACGLERWNLAPHQV